MSALFDRVLRYCARWSVPVRFDAYDTDFASREWHGAPSAAADIHWPTRTIWWADARDDRMASELLHELAHCVDPLCPREAEELEAGPLFAFQWYSARRLRVPAGDCFANWNVGEAPEEVFGRRHSDLCGGEWAQLPAWMKSRLLRMSLKHAVERGVLTKDGRPTFRRPS